MIHPHAPQMLLINFITNINVHCSFLECFVYRLIPRLATSISNHCMTMDSL